MVCFDVKKGKIVRGRSLHFDSKYPGIKTWTITSRGKSFTPPNTTLTAPHNLLSKGMIDSPVKLLYPLKRVDWEPGGDPDKINTQNRGVSKYKRISWDEATTIVANEMTRVAEKYGPEAVCVYGTGMGEPKVIPGNMNTHKAFADYYLLAKYGGLPSNMQAASGSFIGGQGYSTCLGFPNLGYELGSYCQDVMDNTELSVVWPGDTETKTWAQNTGLLGGFMVRFMKELGIKMVHVESVLTKGGGIYADKWIPIICGTDCAMQLALAYTWITEDTYDKDYVDTHTIGFDAWKAYVMGDEDGVPKTPEWAAPICGVPEWTIKALARDWASKVTSVTHGAQGGGVCRAPYSSEPSRMEAYLLGMQGWGNPGVHQIRIAGAPGSAAGVQGIYPPQSDTPAVISQISPNSTITSAMMRDLGAQVVTNARAERQVLTGNNAKCILNPPQESWELNGVHKVYPSDGKSEIHMIWTSTDAFIGMGDGANERFQAYRSPKIESLIAQNMYLKESQNYADLILPICTQLECEDLKWINASPLYSVLIREKGVRPRGEAKTDFGATVAIAEKLGFADKILEGYANEEEFNKGQLKSGYEGSGWKDMVNWEDLDSNGYFCVEPPADWDTRLDRQAFNFYEKPDDYPLSTPSGKFEFESQFIKNTFPDDKERPPVAHYIRGGPESEGWTHDEDHLLSERAKEYPLVVVSNVRMYALMTMTGDLPAIREITKQKGYDGYMYENLWIHPTDAEARGIENGDIVRFYNERGSVLGAALVTERVCPGVVNMPKGQQLDYIIPAEVDRSGCPNTISPQKPLSKHCTVGGNYYGFLVQLEKVTGSQMDEWREKYPEAFSRAYDPAYGTLFNGWVEGGNV
jgi:trimethylamine-N-oxide reductase (cytochrome c)